MVQIPVRKCYQLAKISIVLVSVVALLTLWEQWRGGKRAVRAEDAEDAEFERQVQADEALHQPLLGAGGLPAILPKDEVQIGEQSEKKYAMNVYLSDRIPYNRTLKDYRNPACERVTYDAQLPSASVVIVFHNEPYSALVRTVVTVLNSAKRSHQHYKQANFRDTDGHLMTLGYKGQSESSEYVYLKEIILVDDNSTLPELHGKLSYYVRTRLPANMIHIVRLPQRVGLTAARQTGARAATGDVLVFLDAHCEPVRDFLRPLLQRIKNKRSAALTPLIDTLEKGSFGYSGGDFVNFEVGGFTFAGHFTWIDVSEQEKQRRGSDIAPTWSPTMAGGLFAISRDYFWELGGYDEQMAGWGGENLEMSFRVWQCGGSLETVPCSRVGHVFRSFHPYGLPAHSDTHGINTARMAEVWMDEYKELFYLHRPDLRGSSKVGDVTHRKVLREKLRCRSFKWFLDSIYPQKFIPVVQGVAWGRLRNAASSLCVDTLQRESEGSALGAYPCHPVLQPTQMLHLTSSGHLRTEERCAYLSPPKRENGDEPNERTVRMTNCREGDKRQIWHQDPGTGVIRHSSADMCIAAPKINEDLKAVPCRTNKLSQRWLFDFNEKNQFEDEENLLSPDQLAALMKLSSHSRVSRSLLAINEDADVAAHVNDIDAPPFESSTHDVTTDEAATKTMYDAVTMTVVEARRKSQHHTTSHKKQKKNIKNKFILKLVRRRNNVTEHIEADLYCKHTKLYPNNTFVRDLVTILNAQDVKVINNGRVFERAREVRPTSAAPLPAPRPPARPQQQPVLPPSLPLPPRMPPSVPPPLRMPHSLPPPQYGQQTAKGTASGLRLQNTNKTQHTANKTDHIIVEEFVPVVPDHIPPSQGALKQNQRGVIHKRRHKLTPSTLLPPDGELELVKHASKLQRLPKRQHHPEPAAPQMSLEYNEAPRERAVERDREREEDVVREKEKEISGEKNSEISKEREAEHPADIDKEVPTSRAEDDDETEKPRGNLQLDRRANEQTAGARTHSAPVKLVVRSNLTFNLGDEFFNWRRHNLNIKAVLSELADNNSTSVSEASGEA